MIADTLTVLVIGMLSTVFIVTGGYFRYFVESNRVKRVLALILVTNGLFILKDVIYYLPIMEGGHFYKTLLTVDNWAVAFDIIYIFELLRPGSLNYRKAFLSVLPFIVLTVIYAITCNDTVYHAISIFTYLYCAVCFIFVIRGAVKYWHISKNLYSDLHRADIRWLLVSIFILFLLFALWQLLYFSGNDNFDIYYYILMSVVFGVICYKTYYLEVPSEEEYLDVSEVPDKDVSEAGRHDVQFAMDLKELEESGFFFKHPHLSLSELAAELKTNRTTLSEYINRSAGVSYYDFINDIKLKEVVRLLDDASNLTQEDIAERSGFNSISTFRRAFQKKYKMSLQEYRKVQK